MRSGKSICKGSEVGRNTREKRKARGPEGERRKEGIRLQGRHWRRK